MADIAAEATSFTSGWPRFALEAWSLALICTRSQQARVFSDATAGNGQIPRQDVAHQLVQITQTSGILRSFIFIGCEHRGAGDDAPSELADNQVTTLSIAGKPVVQAASDFLAIWWRVP